MPPSGDNLVNRFESSPLCGSLSGYVKATAQPTTMDSCRYHNASNQMVILRCIGPETFFQEKVVFPFEDWLFRCPPHSRVDIWSHGLTGAEQLDSIPAQDLLLSAELIASVGGKASPDGDWASGTLPQQADQRTGPAWTALPALLPWPPTRSPSSMPTKA
jgi:hypothetical protein